MNKEMIEQLLYNTEKKEILKAIDEIKDEKTLFVYAYNYNWDNGFEIPKEILNNSSCTLSIAMLLFWEADGLSYLLDKSLNDNLPEWFAFISMLYDKIVNNMFINGMVACKVPLTKVQIFKLSKTLTAKEKIFVNNIEGEDMYLLI